MHLRLLLLLCVQTAIFANEPFALWNEAAPYPKLSEIATAPGVEYSVVHAQTPDYQFLHEPRLDFLGDTLFVNFSNAPLVESEPAQIIRGRRSKDGGRTWSEPEIVAGPLPNEERYETAPMLSLWSLVGRYGKGSKNSLGMELHALHPKTDRFMQVSDGFVLPSFVPFVRPQRMDNGDWIVAGHMDKVTHSAVAISSGDDLKKWRLTKIETPQPAEYPETTLLLQKERVIAIIRHAEPEALKSGVLTALAAESRDHGATFSAVRQSNLPMQNSKPFSGTLSTGQSYVIYNAAEGPRRNALLIAVSAPGDLLPLRKVWKVMEGGIPEVTDALKEMNGAASTHEWAYPEAVEKDGILYIVFSQDKRHCWLARIPVASLK